ncbi:MAG: DUF3696 domain-containing protein [Candidatus Thorarchaeota archaeon]
MITKLYLKNYRAYEEISLDFSKVNLFFGPNNSGKSSLLSSLNVLSQTLQSKDRSVPILLNGNKEELGTYRDVVFNNNVSRNIKIGLNLNVEIRKRILDKESGKVFIKDEPTAGFFSVEFKYRPRRREIIINSTESEIPIAAHSMKTICSSSYRHHLQCFDETRAKTISGKARFMNFLPLYMGRYARSSESQRKMMDFHFSISEILESLEYICPFRESPKRTYLFSGISPTSVGIHGEKAIDLLVMDSLKKGKQKRDIINKVAKWLNQFEIAKDIHLHSLTDRHYEIKLQHFKTGERENLADVGFGCSQVLPILIGGYNLRKDDIFIVEEPEIHLHPKAQSELGSFFYNLCEKGIQTFIETHSEHLLLRIQAHVAAGELNPNDIKIYYVYSNAITRKKEVVEIVLDKHGRFLTQWPEGFFPERLIEAKKIAKASLKAQ